MGEVVRVGEKVKEFQVGDRAGIGAQVWACLECEVCKSDNENYCPHQVGEYEMLSGKCLVLTRPLKTLTTRLIPMVTFPKADMLAM